MTIDAALLSRCENQCELCTTAGTELTTYELPDSGDNDNRVVLCETCQAQPDNKTPDLGHLRCLSGSIWSPTPAVQVLAWRLLNQISAEGWAQELLETAYLEDDIKVWAEAGIAEEVDESLIHKDSNGAQLFAGDTVTIIKDLNVKGTSFTAKRGTAVRGISLTDNPEHIEGRVNGTRIVILTCFVKKS